ncbi:MAG: EAL domain-containing protein [Burkholderiales bacterium]|nr:EAL domain-containing protein [Burkholderiales bacterium]
MNARETLEAGELLRAIILNLAEGVLIYDSEGRVVTANPAAETILGQPLSALAGSRPTDRGCFASPLDPVAWPVDRHPPLDTLATGQAHRGVVKGVLRPDGSRAWISVSTTLVELPPAYGGRGVVGSFVDVTAMIDARRKLEQSEARFRDLTELSADWYWEQDAEFRFVDMSQGVHSTGFPAERFIGKRRWDLPWTNMTDDDWAEHRAQLDRHEPFHDLQLRSRDAKGDGIVIAVSGKPVFDAQGAFTGYRGVGRNITLRKRTKRSLREIAERFRSLTELSSDWYWEMDAELRFTYVSEGIRKVRGVAPESLIGKRRWEFDRVGGEEEMARHRVTLESHLPFRDFVLARRTGEGRITYVSHAGKPIFDAQGIFRGYRGVARDITAQVQAEDELARMAHYDALTGLPNRALLQGRLKRAMSRADRGQTLLAVMFLDLDQFKEINDSLGHAVGDAVLKETAQRLEASLRATDTVARLGGDEFTILLEDVRSVEEIARIADKLLRAIAERADVAGHEMHLSTSIGVTVYPLDHHDADTLLRNADLAMYHAKQEGRNNVQFFSREMSERTEKRVDLLGRLRGAIARGELQLHYQPQVDVRSGRVTGVEALLRWNDAERGQVPPMQFIPLAEDTGLIVDIGEWALREACRQAKTWLDAGLAPLTMAVNLSPRQFRQKNLVSMVATILAETALPPDLLELEITESTVMHRTEEATASLRSLHELGVRISLDDFGTGYSSLAYLHRFPVHTLKVDQSFVRDIRSDRDDAAIVSTVITLARQLSLKALAEGVETEGQLAFLRVRGCDSFQGYLFCRPQPAKEMEEILRRHRGASAPAPGARRPRRARRGVRN